jgi:hypothetical protein
MLCAGTFSHNDADGRSERALSVGLEFCALGRERAAALIVAHGQLCPALLANAQFLELADLLLGLALGFLDAEGLSLLLADDTRAFLGGNLAAKRVEVKGGSLGVLRSQSVGVVAARLVLQALNLLEPLTELILLLLEPFRSQILGLSGLGFGEGREVLFAGVELGHGCPIRGGRGV